MTDYAALMRMLEELDAKATPGPWVADDGNFFRDGSDDDPAEGVDFYIELGGPEEDLIVALRNSLPALLDALAIAAAAEELGEHPMTQLLDRAQEIRKEKGK